MPRSLRAGDRGPDVQALQQGLRKALRDKAVNNGKGVYGSLTVRDVAAFKRAWTSESDGHFAGALVWKHLEQYLGAGQRRLLRQAQALEVARQHESKEQALRGAIVAEAYWALANNGLFVYRQYRPMPASLRVKEARDEVDCSTLVTLCYKAAGAIDPNGLGYNGQGYTGSQWGRGEAIASPQPGDVAFYGNMGNGIPSHEALVVDGGNVISFGHTPISKYPLHYRASDYRGSRRYSVV
jgi:cell wall-associated NlpC family hydrolase